MATVTKTRVVGRICARRGVTGRAWFVWNGERTNGSLHPELVSINGRWQSKAAIRVWYATRHREHTMVALKPASRHEVRFRTRTVALTNSGGWRYHLSERAYRGLLFAFASGSL